MRQDKKLKIKNGDQEISQQVSLVQRSRGCSYFDCVRPFVVDIFPDLVQQTFDEGKKIFTKKFGGKESFFSFSESCIDVTIQNVSRGKILDIFAVFWHCSENVQS